MKVTIKKVYVVQASKAVNMPSQYVDPHLRLREELRYSVRQFKHQPSRRWVSKALQAARKLGQWEPLSLTGLYMELYERRYYRQWPGSAAGLAALVGEMRELNKRVEDEAPAAIEAVFSPKMRWVTNHVGLLLSKDNYARHIVPIIGQLRDDRKRRGEQAEWEGERSEDASCEEVSL